MAKKSNLFGRYVWLVDLLRRHKRLTFNQIKNYWSESGLNSDDQLTQRTFHNHRDAIFDIFNIEIRCDNKNGYKYYIDCPEDLENDSFRSWLVDSYATLNQLLVDQNLEGRIQFENIPSGNLWLTTILQAIRENKVLTITHQGFKKEHPNTFDIEPYYLKVVKRRWYVIARSPFYSEQNLSNPNFPKDKDPDVFLVYALDRILKIEITEKRFVLKKDFDINEFYRGCTGIIPSKDPIINVVIRAYGDSVDYIRTLPLHASQKEIETQKDYSDFSYDIKYTYEFLQLILMQGKQVEVISPQKIRDDIKQVIEEMARHYK